jgi:hypothetical protein
MTGKPTEFDYIIIPKQELYTAGRNADKREVKAVDTLPSKDCKRTKLHYDAFHQSPKSLRARH